MWLKRALYGCTSFEPFALAASHVCIYCQYVRSGISGKLIQAWLDSHGDFEFVDVPISIPSEELSALFKCSI